MLTHTQKYYFTLLKQVNGVLAAQEAHYFANLLLCHLQYRFILFLSFVHFFGLFAPVGSFGDSVMLFFMISLPYQKCNMATPFANVFLHKKTFPVIISESCKLCHCPLFVKVIAQLKFTFNKKKKTACYAYLVLTMILHRAVGLLLFLVHHHRKLLPMGAHMWACP